MSGGRARRTRTRRRWTRRTRTRKTRTRRRWTRRKRGTRTRVRRTRRASRTWASRTVANKSSRIKGALKGKLQSFYSLKYPMASMPYGQKLFYRRKGYRKDIEQGPILSLDFKRQ